MTMQPHADIGHLTNTQDPAWCVYCGSPVAPPAPPWTWPGARAEVTVRAAETARRQYQDRRRGPRWPTPTSDLDALVAWATDPATWTRIARGITAA